MRVKAEYGGTGGVEFSPAGNESIQTPNRNNVEEQKNIHMFTCSQETGTDTDAGPDRNTDQKQGKNMTQKSMVRI